MRLGRNWLKIDVDEGHKPLSVGELQCRFNRAGVKVLTIGQWRSPSGKGWHVVVELDREPDSATEIVALQMLAGSDLRRESYNMNRARHVDASSRSGYWDERWNVLYGRPAADHGRADG